MTANPLAAVPLDTDAPSDASGAQEPPTGEDGAPGPVFDGPGPGAPPSREEIRSRVEQGLRNGSLDQTAILADIYASQYAFEMNLRQLVSFLDGFAMSGIGKRLFKKTRRQVADAAAEFESELEEGKT